MRRPLEIYWQEISWVRPFDFQVVLDFIIHLSGYTRRKPFIWEITFKRNSVKYYLGVDKDDRYYLLDLMKEHNPIESKQPSRQSHQVNYASQLLVKHSHLSLCTDAVNNFTRSALSVCHILKDDEELVVQFTIGKSRSPKPIPKELSIPPTWWQLISGNIPQLSSNSEKLMREKLKQAHFQVNAMVGYKVKDTPRKNYLEKALLSSFRILDSSGASVYFKSINPCCFNKIRNHPNFPLILSSKELASFLLLPHGEERLAGITDAVPKQLLPPIGMQATKKHLIFGRTTTSNSLSLGIMPKHLLSHLHLLGGTGSGKSTAILNLFLELARRGHSLVLIDPKGDLVRDVLERLPKERDEDIVILDPSIQGKVVGINPFDLTKHGISSELVADMLLGIFQDLFPDHFGIRSMDILSHSLLTLAKSKDSNLLMLYPLLINKGFRNGLLKNISDPFLLYFWQSFDGLSRSEQNLMLSPVLNKLRQIILREDLRFIFGQSNTNFSLMDIFIKRKILLIPLNRGVLGRENVKFISTLIIGCLWQLTLKRTEIPAGKRHYIYFFLDELTECLKTTISLDDALSLSRSLGVGYILANQFTKQLPANLKASIKANVKNKIVFGLSMDEAREIASETNLLSPDDFHSLPPYHIYARLPLLNNMLSWVSGITNPTSVSNRNLTELYAKSLTTYGTSTLHLEDNFKQILDTGTLEDPSLQNVGRKAKKEASNGIN